MERDLVTEEVILPYRVGIPSTIHGVGAFAIQFIPKGTQVPMPPKGSEFDGFNHSCEPNLSRHGEEDYDLSRREALRDIQVGEELTVSYDLSPDMKVYCHCEVCKGKQPAQTCHCPIHSR